MDDIASTILKQKADRRAVARTMREVMRRRAYANEHINRHSRICPACGCGLKIRVFPNPPTTYITCPSCGASKMIPIAMDEGRMVGEEYIPGVTPGSKEVIKVFMSPDGKVRKVRRGK